MSGTMAPSFRALAAYGYSLVSKPLTSEIPTHVQPRGLQNKALQPPAPSLRKVGVSLLPNVTVLHWLVDRVC